MVILRRKNIKGKIKYSIKDKLNKKEDIRESKIEKNKITYNENNTLVKVIIKENELLLTRENSEIKQIIIFKVNKKTISEYYIKDMSVSLEFNIYTRELIIENNHIHIKYLIEDTKEEFEYDIEVLNAKEEL